MANWKGCKQERAEFANQVSGTSREPKEYEQVRAQNRATVELLGGERVGRARARDQVVGVNQCGLALQIFSASVHTMKGLVERRWQGRLKGKKSFKVGRLIRHLPPNRVRALLFASFGGVF